MYLVVIAWIYVVLMMSVAEATNSTGTLLGAVVTFVLYGVVPVALVVYLMSAPSRSKAIKKRAAEEFAQQTKSPGVLPSAGSMETSVPPDTGSHAAGGVEPVASPSGIAPVRKEP